MLDSVSSSSRGASRAFFPRRRVYRRGAGAGGSWVSAASGAALGEAPRNRRRCTTWRLCFLPFRRLRTSLLFAPLCTETHVPGRAVPALYLRTCEVMNESGSSEMDRGSFCSSAASCLAVSCSSRTASSRRSESFWSNGLTAPCSSTGRGCTVTKPFEYVPSARTAMSTPKCSARPTIFADFCRPRSFTTSPFLYASFPMVTWLKSVTCSPSSARARACSLDADSPWKWIVLSRSWWHFVSHSRNRLATWRSFDSAESCPSIWLRLSRNDSLLRVTLKRGPKKRNPRMRRKASSGSTSRTFSFRLSRTSSMKGSEARPLSGTSRPCQNTWKRAAGRSAPASASSTRPSRSMGRAWVAPAAVRASWVWRPRPPAWVARTAGPLLRRLPMLSRDGPSWGTVSPSFSWGK